MSEHYFRERMREAGFIAERTRLYALPHLHLKPAEGALQSVNQLVTMLLDD